MLGEISIILLLILINAFFAMSEMAVVSSSKPLLRQLSQKGNKRASIALSLAEESGKFLSTIQVGITLIGILAGAYAGVTIAEELTPKFRNLGLHILSEHAESISVALVVSIITFLSVIIGELIPKQIALSNSEKVAMLVARPMKLILIIAFPLVYLFGSSAKLIMKLLGILTDNRDKITENEIQAILDEGAETGVIEKSEHEMFKRIIKLDERDVKSIMTHRNEVEFIDIKDGEESIKQIIKKSQHSIYPVIDGDTTNIIGIIQAKKLLKNIVTNKEIKIVDAIEKIVTIPETATCLGALEIFKKSKVNISVVVDEYGCAQGIITLSDLMESIVGVISSNYDEGEESGLFKRDDGSWLVNGRTPIEEVDLLIDIEGISADNDYDTIAGFLIKELRDYPKEGAKIEKFGYLFEILDMDGHRIDKILIQKLQKT